MQLMDLNDYDMARYVLTKANSNFSHIRENDDKFDLDSSVGDWLNVIKELTTFFNKKQLCVRIVRRILLTKSESIVLVYK